MGMQFRSGLIKPSQEGSGQYLGNSTKCRIRQPLLASISVIARLGANNDASPSPARVHTGAWPKSDWLLTLFRAHVQISQPCSFLTISYKSLQGSVSPLNNLQDCFDADLANITGIQMRKFLLPFDFPSPFFVLHETKSWIWDHFRYQSSFCYCCYLGGQLNRGMVDAG